MIDAGTTSNPSTTASAEAPSARAHLVSVLEAARAAERPDAALRDAFRAVATSLDATAALLAARRSGTTLDDDWHRHGTDPGFWRQALNELSIEVACDGVERARVYRVNADTPQTVAILAVPLVDDRGTWDGTAAFVVHLETPDVARARLGEAVAMMAAATMAASSVGAAREAGGGANAAGVSALGSFDARQYDGLLIEVVNRLRSRLGCAEVAIGRVRGRRVQVTAVSGVPRVNGHAPGVRRLQAAMEECFDAGCPIVCPGTSDPGELAAPGAEAAPPVAGAGHRLNDVWRRESGSSSSCTVPVQDGDDVVAIIAVRGLDGQTLSEREIALVRSELEPVVRALPMVERATWSLPRHAVDATATLLRTSITRNGLARRLVLLALFAAVAWLAVGTLPHAVTVHARIQPDRPLHLSVPWEGVLISAPVAPGDTVRAGTPIFALDATEHELERARLLAELEALRLQSARGLDEGDLIGRALAEAQADAVRGQLALVERRIEQSVVRAPADGIVMEGDPRQLVGSRLTQGEPLVVIALAGQHRIELDVRESDVGFVEAGLVGKFATHARPEQRHAIRLERVRPAADTTGPKPVFHADAGLESSEPWMRAGMEGVARLDVGSRPAWWVLSHRAVDFLRRSLWW